VAALMAALEMAQGDEGRAREWMARALNARRDPAWTADAFVSDHWLPISPVSGRLDAFEWKDPLAGEDHGTVIEHRAEVPASVPATIETPQAGPAAASARSASAADDDRTRAGPSSVASGEREQARQADEAESRADSFPADAEREPARPADEPEFRPPSAEEEQRAREEDSRSPFFAGGRRERRARAAAMANKSRASRSDMTPIAPAVIPLVHAPDDPGPNGETPAEPEPPPASWSRIRALFKS
jgi:HemY protein